MTHNFPTRRSMLAASGVIACLAARGSWAQNVAWPSFGPTRDVLRLDGLTDTLPDVVGPVDGSAELTIFTEGNHYPVLLPLVFDGFPGWCERAGGCRADPARILVVTLPQPMVVEMLLKGGVRLGNAVVPVGRDQRVFPDFVMAGPGALRRLASAGLVEDRAILFARHRGLGLLLRRDLAHVNDIASFVTRVPKVIMASKSEPGARNQYLATLEALAGKDETARLLMREIGDFSGRLGIQHRDVPYALLNHIADGGLIFSHLAAFYAQKYPDRLRYVAVPAAEPFGEDIAVARTTREQGPLAAAFERFFLDAARTAYPDGGFVGAEHFRYGSEISLTQG